STTWRSSSEGTSSTSVHSPTVSTRASCATRCRARCWRTSTTSSTPTTQAVYNVIGGDRYATVTQELKDYLQGLYGRPPVPADHELRRLVLGREEPITIRPADLLEPQVEISRQQVRKMGYEPTDDNVLIHLMFPNLAQEYLRGPPEKASDPPKPAPAASTAPAMPPVAAD